MSVFVRKIFGWLFLTHLIWSGQSYHCGGQFWSSKSQFLSAYVPCRIQNDHPGLMALPSDNFQLARQPQDDRFESSKFLILYFMIIIVTLMAPSLSSWHK